MASKPTQPRPLTFEVSADQLERALGAVIHAAATDKARPILATVLFDFTRKGKASALRIVACDNYRIAMMDVEGDYPADAASFAITREDAAEILGALTKWRLRADQASVTFTRGDSATSVAFAGVTRTIQPVDGQYPNFDAVIPKLTAAQRRKAYRIGFDPSLLADLAKAAKALGAHRSPQRGGHVAILTGIDPLHPFTVEISGADGFREVIMPVRLSGSDAVPPFTPTNGASRRVGQP